ncbi:MAG: PQQ-like beta-propeller repeat protein [Planctomycetaceae bacterium]|nr:PQQ-like beta-propeller repeat protein [Planctomycetaceae bacterium]
MIRSFPEFWFAPLVIVVLGSLSFADDWPNLRGKNSRSVSEETGLDDQWDVEEPLILWARELGQGYSSLAVARDRCFTQYQNVYGQYVICLDAKTGKTLWEHRYEAPYEMLGIYPGPRSTPAVDGNHVYFASPDGLVGCLKSPTGDVVWTVNINTQFGGRGTDFGYSASPILFNDLLLLPVGGDGASVIALNPRTGKTVWTNGSSSASYASIFPFKLEGRSLVLAYLENDVVVHELETGKIVWKQRLSHGYDEHSASPLYEEPILVLSAPFKAGATAYELSWEQEPRTSQIIARELWHNAQFSNDVVSATLVNGKIYGFDLRDPQSKAHRPSRGEFRCLDLQTGEVHWSTSDVGQASVIAVDGKLLLFADTGELILAEESAERYVELGRVSLFPDEVCWTSPALADGRLFLRSHSRAVCASVKDKGQLTEQEQQTAIAPTDLPTSRRTDWSWLLNGEREHPFMRPDVHELSRWFFESLVVLLLSLGAAAVCWGAIRIRRPGSSAPFLVFCCAGILLGVIATPLLNDGQEPFHFTWPASLFSIFLLTIWAGTRASRPEATRTIRVQSRLTGLGFLLVCLGYFLALQRLSLPHEWVFLMGFLPAAPFTILAVRSFERTQFVRSSIRSLIAFSLFFWSCGGLMLLRTAWDF